MPGFSGVFSFVFLKCLVSDSSKMNSRYILPSECSFDCPIGPAALAPRLLPGETTQGFLTASYVQPQTHSKVFDELTLNRASFKRLL